MHEKRYRLPPLDFIQGFEAAARNLSFTKAAEELFITQSAVSRQIKALEDDLGLALFERRPRALALTDEGEAFYRTVADTLDRFQDATERLRASGRTRPLAVTTSIGFASLWLIPRLQRFTRAHPTIDVRLAATNDNLNLERSLIDVAIRLCRPENAPPNAIRLFGSDVTSVCSPALLNDPLKPLKTPGDLAAHVLLHFDFYQGQSFLDWNAWLTALGVGDITPSAMRFSQYDQMIQAAISGQGVALGIMPLIDEHLQSGRLVAPFDRSESNLRAYFLIKSQAAKDRPAINDFIGWILDEAKDVAG